MANFDPPNLENGSIDSPRGPSVQKLDFRKSKMADGRHLIFRFSAIISASINIFAPNLVQWWKIGSPRVPLFRSRIFENPRWLTAAILDFDFGPYFRTKFGTEMENRQTKGTRCSCLLYTSPSPRD